MEIICLCKDGRYIGVQQERQLVEPYRIHAVTAISIAIYKESGIYENYSVAASAVPVMLPILICAKRKQRSGWPLLQIFAAV